MFGIFFVLFYCLIYVFFYAASRPASNFPTVFGCSGRSRMSRPGIWNFFFLFCHFSLIFPAFNANRSSKIEGVRANTIFLIAAALPIFKIKKKTQKIPDISGTFFSIYQNCFHNIRFVALTAPPFARFRAAAECFFLYAPTALWQIRFVDFHIRSMK